MIKRLNLPRLHDYLPNILGITIAVVLPMALEVSFNRLNAFEISNFLYSFLVISFDEKSRRVVQGDKRLIVKSVRSLFLGNLPRHLRYAAEWCSPGIRHGDREVDEKMCPTVASDRQKNFRKSSGSLQHLTGVRDGSDAKAEPKFNARYQRDCE
jgi:hypothetical protein